MRILRISLIVVSVLLGGSYAFTGTKLPLGAQERVAVRAVARATASDSLVLTYVCGSIFRLHHNGRFSTDTVLQWVSSDSDTGAVLLPVVLPGRQYAETFFDVGAASSVSIFGFPGLREARGASAPCTPSRDTTWPIASTLDAVYALFDRTVRLPGPTVRDSVFGRIAHVRIDDTLSRNGLATVLGGFDIRVVGFTPSRGAILRIDKIRGTYAGLISLIDSLTKVPGITTARFEMVSNPTRISIGR